MTTNLRLFRVTTIRKSVVKRYHDHQIDFDRRRREHEPRRPYATLIADYDPDDYLAEYAEMVIEGFFDLTEASRLKAWHDRYKDEYDTTITEVDLPIPNDSMPSHERDDIKRTGDYYGFSETDLGFNVLGYGHRTRTPVEFTLEAMEPLGGMH